MYAGQYRNNPILENQTNYSSSTKTRKLKPKPSIANSNVNCTPKRKDKSIIFASVPLLSWLFTNPTSKVMKLIALYLHISSYIQNYNNCKIIFRSIHNDIF